MAELNEQFAEGAAEFDRLYFERFGRYPAESPLASSTGRRIAAVQRLAEQGATEGERSAARSALQRLEAEQMRRAGNHITEAGEWPGS